MSNAPVVSNGPAPDENKELIQLVTFELASEVYAVEVLSVREIIRMTPITHMPGDDGARDDGARH